MIDLWVYAEEIHYMTGIPTEDILHMWQRDLSRIKTDMHPIFSLNELRRKRGE